MAAIQASMEEERLEVERGMAGERAAIEAQQNLADEDRQQLLQDLEERRLQKQKEEEEGAAMLQKLKAMEDKMLVGTQVMDKAIQQEMELRKAQMEVDERKRHEQRMKEELEEQEQEKLNLEEKYASAEEQVQKMTAKLEKLWNRHKQTQQEIQDLQEEFQTEREDMLETIRDLRKEVKLVCLTIENFIPMEHYKNIERLAEYDESIDEWVIRNIDLAGNRVRPHRKRILDDERDVSPRMPRGNHDMQNGNVADASLMNERPNVYFVYTEDGSAQRAEGKSQSTTTKANRSHRSKSAGRPGTASRKGRAVKTGASGNNSALANGFLHTPDEEAGSGPKAAFPKARGLVRAA